MVKDLLTNNPFDWNYNLIQEKFLPIDSNQIIKLPIIQQSKEDELMWMYDKSGNYTVKSGYATIQSWKKRDDKEPSTSSNNDVLWNKLWHTHTIPRHRMLLWLVINNSPSLRVELNKKGVHCSILCPYVNIRSKLLHTYSCSVPILKKYALDLKFLSVCQKYQITIFQIGLLR